MTDWRSIIAWAGALVLVLVVFADELLGLLGVGGLRPITVDAETDPLLAVTVGAGGLVFAAWWVVHLRNNRP